MNYLRRIIQMFVLFLFPFSAIGCLMLGSSELIGESSEAKEWAVSIEEFLKLCVTGTTEEIQKAIDNGADGGKVVGAGGGGFLMFYVFGHCHDDIRKALNLPEVKFNIENEGTKLIWT